MDISILLAKMGEYKASDLYLTAGLPPSWRSNKFISESNEPLTQDDIYSLLHQVTTEDERERFHKLKELNIAYDCKNGSRYRINLFFQQSNIGMVIRKMQDRVPSIEELGLDQSYIEAVMESRGLVLVTGTTGCGKSTSIASMLDYRNNNGSGHVITIEDPIEYVHKHNKCIFTQREIGFDTLSWTDALKNALRQRPDVIFIGEIRDAETMAQAISFAETGHLCIATLHATSASQAVERIANFFPAIMREQHLYSLAQVLKFIFAQRLVPTLIGDRKVPAIEILRNIGFIKTLIIQGKINEIRELIGKNADVGMRNFEISLMNMLKAGLITEETAIAESDSPDDMRLNIMRLKVRPSEEPIITHDPKQF